jgi:hypothetical protein
MSEQNPIRIFVTHMFAEHPDYARVFDYLESVSNFFYVNCSDIEAMPPSGGKEAIRASLRDQIRAAEVVILITSMYSENRDLIDFQINTAKAAEIAVVGIEPFGGGKVPEIVAAMCDEVVGWNDRMMVDAVRRQARHEETTRWDVIEFDMS